MKKRILFVDDEPMILQGLQRMLRGMRDEWEMTFLDGGEKALTAMEASIFDVVVTDMRMPVMNGAQLLHSIKEKYPTTIRLILSGHADKDLVDQCLGVAHQYLSKPCDPDQLKAMIRSATEQGGERVSEQVKRVLGSMDQIPSVPAVYQEMQAALAAPDSSAQQLGAIIEQDMGMTSKILKIVNSAFFGLRRTIVSPQEAVSYLGVDTIKALVLVNGIFERALPLGTRLLALEDLWRHSMAVAQGAKAVAQAERAGREETEDAFVGALLEDVGILVLAANFPEAYDRACATLLDGRLQLATVEREAFAVTHAEVGAYLLGLWGIPDPVVRTVNLHHSPFQMPGPGFSPEVAVYAADILVGEQTGNAIFGTGRFDLEALGRLGLGDRVPVWRDRVHGLAAREAQ